MNRETPYNFKYCFMTDKKLTENQRDRLENYLFEGLFDDCDDKDIPYEMSRVIETALS